MNDIYDPSGGGFFGKGFWGRKAFWLNVPSQWRSLDRFNYLQLLLNTWGDAGEALIEKIQLLPKQRDPYEVRTKNTNVEWFYVTEAFKYTDDVFGNVVRLIGERNGDSFPGANLSSPPSTDEDVMSSQYPWYPYEALSNVGRYWQLGWNDVQYEVVNTRLRNYDQSSVFDVQNSLANEVWVKGGDLTLLFDYLNDRLWDIDVADSALRGTVIVGKTDGSQKPVVELPVLPVRLYSRWSDAVSPSTLVEAATVIVRVPLQGGGYRLLYDLPSSIDEGGLYAASGGIIGGSQVGTVDYLSGQISFDLSVLSEFSAQTAADIKAKYVVSGYFMKFREPSCIGYLAKDFGLDNDENDPEDVQRSSIANVTKFWSIKSSADSYRIRGEISLFDVEMQGLYKICSADLAAQIPGTHVYQIGTTLYTDSNPVYIRYDHISADEMFYDYNDPNVPFWITLVDNMLIADDPDRWNGMSIGQGYAVDVTQGYYAPISPTNAVLRGPAQIQTVTPLDFDTLQEHGWVNGYRYVIQMRRCQYEAFNMILDSENTQKPELFALAYMDYNAAGPAFGTPPSPSDVYYYIDKENTAWTLTSSPSSDPKEDIGNWTIDISFGEGVASPLSALDYVAVRYLPTFFTLSCCYCRAHSMRAIVSVMDEAYDHYDTYDKVEQAIVRLKTKLSSLNPIHTQIIEWEITRQFEDFMYGVTNGATVEHSLGGEQFIDNVQVLLTVQYRGDSDSSSANTDLDFRVYSEDTGVVWQELNWNPVTPAGDNETWVDVVVDEEIILPSDAQLSGDPYDVTVRAIAGSASAYGDVRWLFKVTRKES